MEEEVIRCEMCAGCMLHKMLAEMQFHVLCVKHYEANIVHILFPHQNISFENQDVLRVFRCLTEFAVLYLTSKHRIPVVVCFLPTRTLFLFFKLILGIFPPTGQLSTIARQLPTRTGEAPSATRSFRTAARATSGVV